jgi:hypothetical protein
MDDEGEDEILVTELGQLGASLVGGRRTLGVRPGWGARWGARRMGKNVHEMDLTAAGPPDEVADRVASLLGALGRVVARQDPGDGGAVVRGVFGAGSMNLNPAVVTVTMTASPGGGTAVHIRGAAKEGLIKQRAGQKAAERIAEQLA